MPPFVLAAAGILSGAGIAAGAQAAGREVSPVIFGLVLAVGMLALIGLVLLLLRLRRTAALYEAARQAGRRERQLLEKILEALPDEVCIRDAEGRVILDNGSRHPAGTAHPIRLDATPNARLDERERRILETGEPLIAREEPLITPDGQVAWFSTAQLPLRAETEGCRGILSIRTDITDRKAAEEKLRVYSRLLEQSNVELRDFAGVASHDLQEPLRKIQAFSDRIRLKCGDALGPEGLDSLERIQNAASRMQTLIQDLLMLSRISSREFQFVPVDLGQTLHGVLSDLEFRIRQTDAKIEIGPLPVVEADPLQMRQMFQNLIGNALKFHKPGQRPEVTVQGKILRVQDYQLPGASPGDEVARIMVTDNGIGFDEQYVEQIFTLFARLHSREEYEGTGMGLAICRKIAQRHGGSIVAKSAKGQGATFMMMLPVKQKLHPEPEGAT